MYLKCINEFTHVRRYAFLEYSWVVPLDEKSNVHTSSEKCRFKSDWASEIRADATQSNHLVYPSDHAKITITLLNFCTRSPLPRL